jgi:GDP-L-fucose synthase
MTAGAAFAGRAVVVTGGSTGFLGTNVARALLDAGATVHAMSRAAAGRSFFPAGTARLVAHETDLTRPVVLPDGIDTVFHCAAHTAGAHEMATDPAAQVTPNAFMNSLVLEAAARQGVPRFVFVSSSAVYPRAEVPLTEAMGFAGDPPGNFFGPAWMKRYGEKTAEFFHRQSGMGVAVIRPSNVYGPYGGSDRLRAHVLPALIRKCVEGDDPLEVWGTPDVVRDFIYADDFVGGVLALASRSSGFEVWNVGSGRQHTIGEAVALIRELTGHRGRVTWHADRPMTVDRRLIDITKVEQAIGFRAETSFREGLRRTIAWVRASLS